MFVKALEGVVLFLLLAAISIAVVYLVVWVNNVMMSSVANLSGRDACFTAIYAVGLVFFIFASVFLHHSELGRSLKELQVPGGLMGLKIMHLVVGFAGILIVGGFCFLYGYGTASSAQPFPYCADRQVALVQTYPGDKVVIAHVGEVPGTDCDYALEGGYEYLALPNEASDPEQEGALIFQWETMRLIPVNER